MTPWQELISALCPQQSTWERLLAGLLSSTALSGLRGRHNLRKYQDKTIDLIKAIWEPEGPPGVIVALEPGAGKTVSTLTAVRDLLDAGKIKRVLLVAPLLVAETVWHAEIEEWAHLTHTTYSHVTGDLKKRSAAFESDAEIHIINKELVPWLWEFAKDKWKYDCLVIDEASMLKNGKKRTPNKNLTRFGALAQARKHFTGVVELTGTPAPNGVKNLWGLAYIIDQGARLGRSKNAFNERWIDFNKYTYEEKPKPGAEEEIMSKMKDIMFSLDPKDYVELPPLVENVIKVKLPPKVLKEYQKFKKTLVYEPEAIEAVNAAVLAGKLAQAASGHLYNEEKEAIWLHDCKLDALENLVSEIGDVPLLVAYGFKSDKERIKKKFPKAIVLNEQKDVMQTVKDWNDGKIDMLLTHPASAAWGLNLQKGSNHFVWYSLTVDLELFQQFRKRLWRSGQQAERVWSHTIVAEGTIDETLIPVLSDKDAVQTRVLQATMLDISA